MPESELGEGRSTIARALIACGKYDKDRIISFLVFLENFIYVDNDEIKRNFDKLMYEVSRGTIDMGVIEVLKKQERQQGAEQKSYTVVANLIQQLGLDDAATAGVAEVSIDFVKKVRADLTKKKK